MTLSKKLALSKKEVENDPLNLTPRMYAQVGKLLDQLEAQDVLEDGVTVPQRIAALIATGRIMKMMQDLRKGSLDVGAGTSIDKYTAAFQTTDAIGRRKQYSGALHPSQYHSGSDEDPYADADA